MAAAAAAGALSLTRAVFAQPLISKHHKQLYLVPIKHAAVRIPDLVTILSRWYLREWPSTYSHSMAEALREVHNALPHEHELDLVFVVVDDQCSNEIYGTIALLKDDMGKVTAADETESLTPPDYLSTTSKLISAAAAAKFTTSASAHILPPFISCPAARSLSPWLASLYVADAHRGCGIAQSMIALAVQYAATHISNGSTLNLWCEHESLAAWYARLGWRPIARVWLQQRELLVMTHTSAEAESATA